MATERKRTLQEVLQESTALEIALAGLKSEKYLELATKLSVEKIKLNTLKAVQDMLDAGFKNNGVEFDDIVLDSESEKNEKAAGALKSAIREHNIEKYKPFANSFVMAILSYNPEKLKMQLSVTYKNFKPKKKDYYTVHIWLRPRTAMPVRYRVFEERQEELLKEMNELMKGMDYDTYRSKLYENIEQDKKEATAKYIENAKKIVESKVILESDLVEEEEIDIKVSDFHNKVKLESSKDEVLLAYEKYNEFYGFTTEESTFLDFKHKIYVNYLDLEEFEESLVKADVVTKEEKSEFLEIKTAVFAALAALKLTMSDVEFDEIIVNNYITEKDDLAYALADHFNIGEDEISKHLRL